jgi:predicted nucleic acid-binding protein
MITAVDTSVLLDVWGLPNDYMAASARALRLASDRGGLCISPTVVAELAPQFDDRRLLDVCLLKLSIVVLPDNFEVGWLAGRAWAEYRRQGGSRVRVLADFLIAAHALVEADCLLTRDRGFYRQYFADLQVIEP